MNIPCVQNKMGIVRSVQIFSASYRDFKPREPTPRRIGFSNLVSFFCPANNRQALEFMNILQFYINVCFLKVSLRTPPVFLMFVLYFTQLTAYMLSWCLHRASQGYLPTESFQMKRNHFILTMTLLTSSLCK